MPRETKTLTTILILHFHILKELFHVPKAAGYTKDIRFKAWYLLFFHDELTKKALCSFWSVES